MPFLVRLVAAPVSGVLMVSAALLRVIVDAAAKLMAVPPERTMAPEPEANVRVPAFWVPVTETVPAARPRSEPAPKLRSSLVVGLVTAGELAPESSVLQKASVPQVPPAVPKPAVMLLLSQ